MCRSRVPTTYAYDDDLMCRVIAVATSAPPETARLPPSQKSFCTSTTTSARVMTAPHTPSAEPARLLRDRELLAAARPSLRGDVSAPARDQDRAPRHHFRLAAPSVTARRPVALLGPRRRPRLLPRRRRPVAPRFSHRRGRPCRWRTWPLVPARR